MSVCVTFLYFLFVPGSSLSGPAIYLYHVRGNDFFLSISVELGEHIRFLSCAWFDGGWCWGGGGGLYPPSILDSFSFTKSKFTSKNIVINEYEVCLKMLQMTILETQILNICGGGCTAEPPRKLAPSAIIMPSHPPQPLASPGSAPKEGSLSYL